MIARRCEKWSTKSPARHALSNEVIDGVSERPGGVPLFVEEVTRLLLERGAQGGVQAIPPTLQQSLAARLDRLGEAREVAQIGAVLGRDFSYLLARCRWGRNDPALHSALDRLADADLLIVEGAPPRATYRFKHALIQDAAYDSLLKSRRQALHRRAAEILRDDPERAAAEPELVAHHFTEAGLDDLAIEWWGKAGDQALRRSAFQEAIAHLGKAIAMADKAAGSASERGAKDALASGQRLKLHTDYGQAVMWSKGFAAEETKAAFARAAELAGNAGDSSERLAAYYGQCSVRFMRGELREAEETARKYLHEAEASDGPHAAHAGTWLGLTLYLQGNFPGPKALSNAFWLIGGRRTAGRTHSRLDRSRRLRSVPIGFCGPGEGRFSALSRIARTGSQASGRIESRPDHGAGAFYEDLLGRRGLRSRRRAAFRRTLCRVRARARDGLLCRQRRSLVGLGALSTVVAPASRLRRAPAGDRRLRKGRQQGFNAALPPAAGGVRSGCSKPRRRRIHDRRGAESSKRRSPAVLRAILHRVRGDILLKRDPPDSMLAEEAYKAAIAVANEQGARTYGLQAALTLAKLYQSTARPLDAHAVLAPALEGFAPTPEMPEIAEAQTLLAALAASEPVEAELERRKTRSKLHAGYAVATMMTKGFAAEETKAALARAASVSGAARTPEYWTVDLQPHQCRPDVRQSARCTRRRRGLPR